VPAISENFLQCYFESKSGISEILDMKEEVGIVGGNVWRQCYRWRVITVTVPESAPS